MSKVTACETLPQAPAFSYRDAELWCEDVPLRRLGEAVGTPAYVYSHASLAANFHAFSKPFAAIPHLICFAVKANGNLAILRLLGNEGAGADIVSGGELFRAVRAGIEPRRIVFSGVGKTHAELRAALEADILMLNIESGQELQALQAAAAEVGRSAPIALRVNPDVDPQTHPYIATGLKKSKFGLAPEAALQLYAEATRLPNISVIGIHIHIGSQITSVGPFCEAVAKELELVRRLRESGIDLHYLDIGGGLGIQYADEAPPRPEEFAQALAPLLSDTNCTLIVEPGRAIVGNAGVLLTRVLYEKETAAKHFYIVDAAMNDLLRPSIYGAYHDILPAQRRQRGDIVADVVGPICESGDFLARDRHLGRLDQGELLAVLSAGAYGFSMSSNYNARPRVVEVLVKGDEFHVIRERETYADLVAGECIPPFLERP